MRCVCLIAALSALSSPAAADWSVRRDAQNHGELLLRALEKAPEDVPGLQALIDEVGLERAHTLAASRARKERSWQAHLIVGRLQLRRRRLGAALGAFRRALAAAPSKPGLKAAEGGSLLGWIGEELLKDSRSKQAHRLLKAWIDRRSFDTVALKILARIALEKRDLKGAVKYQGKLVEARPTDPQLRLVHARMLRQLGDLDAAVKAYTGALKLIKNDGSLRCQSLAELGQLQETLEQFDAAVESYRRALKLATEGSYVHRQLQEQILRNFQRRRAYGKLEAEAKKILTKQPKHRMALRLLAEQMARLPGKLNEAITYYERYLKVVPSDGKARETLMFMLLGSGRTKDAVPHARALYKANPFVPRRLLEYAGLMETGGDRAGAKKALRDGITSFKKNAGGLQLIVGALQRLKDDEGVKLALAALLKQGGLDDRFLLSYGRRLWQLGRRAEALSFWDRILGDKPTSLAYEQWVEVVLSSRAHVRPKLRPRLQAEAARGLRRYPRHAGLRVLKAQLGR